MIIFVLILGLGLRLISLNQSLWLDEATSALTTRMNLADFFSKFMPGDFHPPLYYLVLRVWTSFFGTSEIALRMPSIFFGIATIYVVYLIGKKLISSKVGILASLLLATSGLHIYYSQEARMYSMSTLLVSLLIFSQVKIIKEKGRVGDWLLFSIILGFTGMTDYLPLFVLPAIWIFGILTKQNFTWWKKFLMSHIILIALDLAWFPVFIKQLTSGITSINSSPAWVNVLGKFSLKDTLLIPVKFAIGRISFDNKLIYGVFVTIILSIFLLLILKSKKVFQKTLLIYLWAIIPLVISLLVSLKIPVLNYFRFLFVLPAVYLIISFGIISLSKKWQAIVIVLILGINFITSFIYLSENRFQREDWRSAVSYIEAKRGEKSIVVFPALSQMEAYRYYAPSASLYGPDALRKGLSQIWLIRYAQPISDPSDSTRQKIESLGYKKHDELDFNGVLIWKYN